MGTVALGGVCNTMPYTFEKVPFKKKPIFNYRLAVQLGLWTCVLLNILWCWAVLDIVPQTIEMACSSRTISGQLYLNSTSVTDVCRGELSLEGAASKGEISTIPLTKLLQLDHPNFTWVAVLIEVFIVVSISVSYLTIGTALHHTLSGIVVSFNMRKSASTMSRIKNKKKFPKEWLAKTGLSMAAFTIVFVVAMLDPEGFVDILEKLVSFTLNTEVGVFIFLMLIFARKEPFKHLEIPLPVSKCLYRLIYLLPLFFNFAVFYDIYSTIADIVNPRQYPSILINISLPGINTTGSDILSNVTGNLSTTTVAHHT
ncbi:unnamed protein product [Lymnaea stagnalis]|uniref:Uncharacterized protein n=1 Tax=Lymnaea stagnalis TaxID=6523 RepID=A0AAV2IF45_LYMST